MATPEEHIKEIRRTKFSIGGELNPLTEDLHQAVKNLSAELYAKDVHFLMELIQNAEDNDYPEGVNPSLELVITSQDITGTGASATLLIFNNEKGFSAKNIESICSVGRSTKKNNRKCGYIGEKGIGFKSVFLITAQPYIFSNGYQIRFNEEPCPHSNLGYIVPEWVQWNPTLDDIKQIYGSHAVLPTTTIILPLKPDKIGPVKEQLSSIQPEVLLFLSKIKQFSVKKHNEDPRLNTVNAISISTKDVTEKECSYYMWRQKFPVRQENQVERRLGVEELVITLAFPFGQRLNRGISSPGVYAFLPTEMVTNFPFIIQADFVLASSRETILLDNKWNQGILDCVPSAFLNAFISLVTTSQDVPVSTLTPMFKFLPIYSSPYPKLNDVRELIKAELLKKNIVPWVSLHSLSSHGKYILNSSFDTEEYDHILNFLGVEPVNSEWYAKCIKNHYGKEILRFKMELQLLGVVVGFNKNYQLVTDHLKSQACSNHPTAEAILLIFECMRDCERNSRSAHKLIQALKGNKCLKTNMGYKFPSECFLFNTEWDSLLKVFHNDFPLIDEDFYGTSILSYEKESRQAGIVVDFEAATQKFLAVFKKHASSSPRECILFGPEWEPVSSITVLPFIDDSDKLSMSSGETMAVDARRMMRWDREDSNLFMQKMEISGGHKNKIEYVNREGVVMATPKEHIEEIRRTKFSIGGELNPLTEDLHQAVKNLSAELYAKDVHFLMELIQNAEDNEYGEGVNPSLELVITSQDITDTGAPATLLIFNNEKGFSAKNIESICSVGRSTKKSNRKQGYIGEKGIGFKSVFLITAQPYIFSNGYQIRFNEEPCSHSNLGYIVPEWVEQNPSLADIKQIYGSHAVLPTTTIILPLKPDKIKPVKQQLSSIQPEVLLFLSKIKHYYMWRQKFPVRQENQVERRLGVEEWVIKLAFPIGQRLNRGMSSPGIYAFLPTEMVTNFPFIIQADFVLASSRETILLDNKWNQGILDCVPSAFLNAFISLVTTSEDVPVSTLTPMFKFLPINSSSYPKLNVVRESIKAKLLTENIIPCESYSDQKIFRKPCEVGRLMPSFWNILKKARKQGVSLHSLSSHGRYILNSSFDTEEHDHILNFLGVEPVNSEWYAKCIMSSKLVLGVTEDDYLELLLFIAEKWSFSFYSTTMKYVPLLKYLAIAYAHFLYHSFSKSYLPKEKVDYLCGIMPLVDNYGHVMRRRKGVLVPANGSKWVGLMGANPWREEGYVELGEDYLRSGNYAGSFTPESQLITFLKTHIAVSDIPDISPPNAELSVADTPLTKKNAFLLLDWIHNLNYKENLPAKFLASIRTGSWLKISLSDSPGYRPPSQSFLFASSDGNLLQDESVMVDIPLIDQEFYGNGLNNYKEELKKIGVMFEYRDMCQFAGKHVMSLATSSALTKSNVFQILNFIKFLRLKVLPADEFIQTIKDGRWLKTSCGHRSPVGSVLFDQEWKAASQISDIPFIDQDHYGKEILRFKMELQLLGVVVGFNKNYQLVTDHLKSQACSNHPTAEAILLIFECMRDCERNSRPADKLIQALKGNKCLKTNMGYKFPSECFLFNTEWGCLLKVFHNDFPLIDEDFYGTTIFSYKRELGQAGVVVDFEAATQKFSPVFKKRASSSSIGREHVLSFLASYRQINKTNNKFPSDFVCSIYEAKWLQTRFGDPRSPRECILFGPEWEPVSSITLLPFIDDSDNSYGKGIHEYRKELNSLGVTIKYRDGVRFVAAGICFPQDPSTITPESVLSLLQCIKILQKYDPHLPDIFRKKVSQSWLKTYYGYRSPDQSLLFGSEWEWVSPEKCVIYDKDGLFSSQFNVLEKHYMPELFTFFSRVMQVKSNPSVDDYCELWNNWENSRERLSHSECCAFWAHVSNHWSKKTQKTLAENLSKLPVESDSDGIMLFDKHDVYIADDLQLKYLFEQSSPHSIFVWYPQPSIPSLSWTKLFEIYRKIGVRTISESVQKEDISKLEASELKQVSQKESLIGRGLLRLILGFLADPSIEMEAGQRQEVVKGLLNLEVFQTEDPIAVSYRLSTTSGETMDINARRMMCWDQENFKLIMEKMEMSGGHKSTIEYATIFAEVISEAVLQGNGDHISALAKLIKLAFLLDFDEEAVGFLMRSKNLQVFMEDEEFLSSAFSVEGRPGMCPMP
ncbi:unnamed protein product, partial [Vitis vinifera]